MECDHHNPNIVKNIVPITFKGEPIRPEIVEIICLWYGVRRNMSYEDYQEMRDANFNFPYDVSKFTGFDREILNYFLAGSRGLYTEPQTE